VNSIAVLELDLQDLENLIKMTSREHIIHLLEEYKEIIIQQLNNEKKFLNREKQKIEEAKLEKNDDKEKERGRKYVGIDKYSWDNEEQYVKIYFTNFKDFKNHPKEKVEVFYTHSEFELRIHDWQNKDYKFIITQLYDRIIPNECSYRQTNAGFIIKLKKLKKPKLASIEWIR